MIQKLIAGLYIFSCVCSAQTQTPSLPPLEIAYLQEADEPRYSSFIDDSVKNIQEALKGLYRVEAVPFSAQELRNAIRKKRIRYFFSNSLFYLSVSASSGPQASSRLAVLWHPKSQNPTYSIGSTVVVKNSSPIKNFSELSNSPIGVLSPDDFMTVGPVRRELTEERQKSSEILDNLVGFGSYRAVAQAVLSGRVTAGILPACFIEDRPYDAALRELKVLGTKNQSHLACKTSTRLYLGPVFASTSDSDPHLNRLIVRELLNTQAHDGYLWTPGGDLSEGHELFKELQQAQYQALSKEFLFRHLEEKLPLILFVCGLILLLIAHWYRVNRLVEKRTAQLKKLQSESDEVKEKLESMERIGVIGLMSSTLSHELKQPISAMGNYVQGLEFLSRSGRMSQEALSVAINNIKAQLDRANQVIRKVRNYAKHKKEERGSVNLATTVKEAVSDFKKVRRQTVSILPNIPEEPVFVEGDSTELHLAVYNLLKNAVEACASVPSPQVKLQLSKQDGKACLTFIDNGPKIDPADIENFNRPLWTSKESGMGLGIPIVRRIAESHRGSLNFDTLPDGTLRVRLIIPLIKKETDA